MIANNAVHDDRRKTGCSTTDPCCPWSSFDRSYVGRLDMFGVGRAFVSRSLVGWGRGVLERLVLVLLLMLGSSWQFRHGCAGR